MKGVYREASSENNIGSSNRKIFQYAVPVMFTLLLQLLSNAIDTILLGRFGSEKALATIGVATPIINLFTNAFLAFSSGASIAVAQSIGLGDKERISKASHTSVLLGVISGVIIAVSGTLLTEWTLIHSGCPMDIFDMAVDYMRYYYLTVPATAVYYFCAAVFRANGDTGTPLKILLGSSILHIAISWYEVVLKGDALLGVAFSTLISQSLSAIITLFLLCLKQNDCQIKLTKLIIDPYQFKRIVSVGLPAMVQSVCMTYSNVVIQSAINSFGTDVIAGATAANSVLNILVNPASEGVVQATAIFVSQAYGGKRYKEVKSIVMDAYAVGVIMTFVLGVATTVFGKPLLAIYTSDNAVVIDTGYVRVAVECLSYFLCAFQGSICSAMRGIDYAVYPLISTVIGTSLFRWVWIKTIFALSPTLFVLYMCYPVSWLITFAYQHYVFERKMNVLLGDNNDQKV